MEDERVLSEWQPLRDKVETIGHQMPDGWWYVYLPFDSQWHFAPNANVQRLGNDGDFSCGKEGNKQYGYN